MTTTVADHILQRLRAWGVQQVFGYAGDGINGLLAFAAERPCVIVFKADPAIPPIPPHATWDQLVESAKSILRGDSDRLDVITEGVKTTLADVLPGRST